MPYANYDNNKVYYFSPHPSPPEELLIVNIHSIHSCSSAQVFIIHIYTLSHVQLSSTRLLITVQPDLHVHFFVHANSLSSGVAIISTLNTHSIVYVHSSLSSILPSDTHQAYINDVSSCINSSGSSTSQPSTYLFIHLSYE